MKITIQQKQLLESITKEELVTVLGNIGDVFQTESDWKGHGFSNDDVQILHVITSACLSSCSEKQNFKLPKIHKYEESFIKKTVIKELKKYL